MNYDLPLEPWIPWRRRSGAITWGRPSILLDGLTDDPVVALAAPRPDFNGAVQEFLVGLLSVALRPGDVEEWLEHWHRPPTVAEMDAALSELPPAFTLDGEGPRFFQDSSQSDLAQAEVGPIEQMLIDAPGDQTAKLNKDLFVKRDRVERLGRPAAAMALITLQTYAPSGGQGHRTSMRGGGPLTVLVDPRVGKQGEWHAYDQPLWYKLWANVETEEQWRRRTTVDVDRTALPLFPWLAPTRISDSTRGAPTMPSDAHPLQAYFGLPRRIRLEFGEAGRCDLTGRDDEVTVTGFRMRNYGVQYTKWRHPLSPHYRMKAGGEWLPVHGQRGGVGWRDWLTLSLPTLDETRRPPETVVAFHDRGKRIGTTDVRLHAFGYDMDNMKARGWIESVLPSMAIEDRESRRRVADCAARLTEAAGVAASAVMGGVQSVYFGRKEDAKGDLSAVKDEFWALTESVFFDAIRVTAGAEATGDMVDDLSRKFAKVLEREALATFDRWTATEAQSSATLQRVVSARYALMMTLRGSSKFGKTLFNALRIPAPGGSATAKTPTAKRKRASP